MKKVYDMIACKATSAFTGVGIFGILYDIVDKVLVSDMIDGSVTYTPRPCTLYSNMKGESYFIHRGKREYLSDYMRTNY